MEETRLSSLPGTAHYRSKTLIAHYIRACGIDITMGLFFTSKSENFLPSRSNQSAQCARDRVDGKDHTPP